MKNSAWVKVRIITDSVVILLCVKFTGHTVIYEKGREDTTDADLEVVHDSLNRHPK